MLNSGKENLEMSRYISYDPLFTLEQLLEIKTGFSGGFTNTLLPSDSNSYQLENTNPVFKKKKDDHLDILVDSKTIFQLTGENE